MIDLNSYLETIRCKSNSVFGKTETYLPYNGTEMGIPLLQAFVDDNDIQEITVSSANFGFNKTYRKFYKREEEWVKNRIEELKNEDTD